MGFFCWCQFCLIVVWGSEYVRPVGRFLDVFSCECLSEECKFAEIWKIGSTLQSCSQKPLQFKDERVQLEGKKRSLVLYI